MLYNRSKRTENANFVWNETNENYNFLTRVSVSAEFTRKFQHKWTLDTI